MVKAKYMNINTLVLLDVPGKNKIAVLSNIAKATKQEGLITNDRTISAELLKTIENKPDIAENGFAFPTVYLKDPILSSSAFILCRAKNPIDFNSQDGKPVQFIVISFIKNNSTSRSLKEMLLITRLLKDAGFLKIFKGTQNRSEVTLLLKKALQGSYLDYTAGSQRN